MVIILDLLFVVSSVLTVKTVVKEKLEPVTPANTHFDWDAYWKDVRNGIGAMEQVKKRERGDYYTTKPLPKQEELIEGVVDMEKYQHELSIYGEEIVETWRRNGRYKYFHKKKVYY